MKKYLYRIYFITQVVASINLFLLLDTVLYCIRTSTKVSIHNWSFVAFFHYCNKGFFINKTLLNRISHGRRIRLNTFNCLFSIVWFKPQYIYGKFWCFFKLKKFVILIFSNHLKFILHLLEKSFAFLFYQYLDWKRTIILMVSYRHAKKQNRETKQVFAVWHFPKLTVTVYLCFSLVVLYVS